MSSPAMGGASAGVASAGTGGVPAGGGKGGGAAMGPSYEGLNAFDQASQAVTQALGGAQGAMNYQPMMVEGGTYDPRLIGSGSSMGFGGGVGGGGGGISIEMLDPTSTAFQAAQTQQADIDKFMNPYTRDVVDQSLADIERARMQQANQAAAQATAAGAFGGSRGALMEAEVARNALEQGARTASDLRRRGFEFASQMGQQDVARRQQALQQNAQQQLQAMLANQASSLSASQTGAQIGAQMGMAGQKLALEKALADQAAYARAREFSLGQGMQAALANQAAGLQGAGQQLSSALGLGNLANLGFGMGQDVLGGMYNAGALGRSINQDLIGAYQNEFADLVGQPAYGQNLISAALTAGQAGSTTTTNNKPGWANTLIGLLGAL